MPIDYSKWDHLDEYSDDDSDNANVNESKSTPRVTRLDAPSSVTFGGGAATVNPSAAAAAALNPSPSSTTGRLALQAGKHPTRNEQRSVKSSWIEKGGEVTTPCNRMLYWSQDRYSVTLRLELFNQERILSVQVNGIVSYTDRNCATSTTKARLQVLTKEQKCLYEGDLPHHVHLPEDEDDIDWIVESNGTETRFVQITLLKAVPMDGLFIWWKRPLCDFPEISIDSESSSASKSQEFMKAWDEAHKMFREKRKTSQPLRLS